MREGMKMNTSEQCFLQLRLTSMFSYMRRKALKPSGCDSMLDTARSVLRMCSRMSACTARGQSCSSGSGDGEGGRVSMLLHTPRGMKT